MFTSIKIIKQGYVHPCWRRCRFRGHGILKEDYPVLPGDDEHDFLLFIRSKLAFIITKLSLQHKARLFIQAIRAPPAFQQQDPF